MLGPISIGIAVILDPYGFVRLLASAAARSVGLRLLACLA